MAFEDLFADPYAAIGFGLLTSRENPLGTAAQMLQQGGESKRKRDMQDLEMKYKMERLTQGHDDPASVREWKIFSEMPDAQKREYLGMKRAQQTLNLGGTQAILDPTGGISESYPVTPKSTETPEYNFDVAKKTTEGRLSGERSGSFADKEVKAADVIRIANQADAVLPKATSGTLEGLWTGVNKMAGRSTEASQADSQLKVIAAALTSNVPRFEGPQGVLDVELYKQAAADVGNASIPYEDRLAALETVKSLQQRYLGAEQGQNSSMQSGGYAAPRFGQPSENDPLGIR